MGQPGSGKELLAFARKVMKWARDLESIAMEVCGYQAEAKRAGKAPGAMAPLVARARARRRRKPWPTCIAPYCRNPAAPRFGMVCAAKHKDMPEAEKRELRAKRFGGR